MRVRSRRARRDGTGGRAQGRERRHLGTEMEGRAGDDRLLGLQLSVLIPNRLGHTEVSLLVQFPSSLSLEKAFPGRGEKC